MLKKTITYRDYNDEERSEDYYFNLSRAEIVMMETSVVGGMTSYYERITKGKDSVAIMECFRELIHMSIGEKSPDGKRFIKNEEIATAFEQSEAYSELIIELLSDANNALDFITAIMPASIAAELANKKGEILAMANQAK